MRSLSGWQQPDRPAQAQTQGREAQLTSEQREILNSLPPDQRDALIDQLLGSGARGAMQRDDQLQFPQSIFPRDPNAEELESEGPFAEPRFRADDTLLLLLQIREFEEADPQLPPVAPPVTPGASRGAGRSAGDAVASNRREDRPHAGGDRGTREAARPHPVPESLPSRPSRPV